MLDDAGLESHTAPPAELERVVRRPLLFRLHYYLPLIWGWLWVEHRAVFWPLFVITRPVAIPRRLWRRWRRGSETTDS